MQRTSGYKACAAVGCTNNQKNSKFSFFRFPKDIHHARIWAIVCGRDDLLEKHNLYTSYRICGAHFENYMFLNDLRNRLQQNVIPTLFRQLEGSSSSNQGKSTHREKGSFSSTLMLQTTSSMKAKCEVKLDETVCKLCLQITYVGNYKIIDAYSKEAIRAVLPQQNLEVGDEQVMCKECSENLFAAFDFKVMCRITEELLLPYIHSKGDGKLDLKEIYLKEKSDGCLTSLTEQENVCRLCVQLTTCNFISLGDVKPDMVGKCILEINFRATSNPVICEGCYKSLVRHSIFVNTFLKAQERVKCIDSGDKIQVKTEDIEIKSEGDCEDGTLDEETGTDNKIGFYQCKTESTGCISTSDREIFDTT